MIKNLNIWIKVFLAIGSVLMVVFLQSVFSWNAMRTVKTDSAVVEKAYTPFVVMISQMETSATRGVSRLKEYFGNGNRQDYEQGVYAIQEMLSACSSAREFAHSQPEMKSFTQPLRLLVEHSEALIAETREVAEYRKQFEDLRNQLQRSTAETFASSRKLLTCGQQHIAAQGWNDRVEEIRKMTAAVLDLLIVSSQLGGTGLSDLNTKSFAVLENMRAKLPSLLSEMSDSGAIAYGESCSTELEVLQHDTKELQDVLKRFVLVGREIDFSSVSRLELSDLMLREVHTLLTDSAEAIDARTRQITNTANFMLYAVLGTALLALLLAVLAGILLARSVVRPVRRCQAFVEAIRTGDLCQTLHLERRDELGEALNDLGARIAEQDQEIKDVKRHRAQLDLVLQRLPGLVTLKNANGQFILMNEAFATIVGCRQADTQELRTSDICCHPDGDILTLMDEEVLLSQRSISMEHQARYRDDSLHEVLVTKVPFPDEDGKECCVLTLGIEITGRKRLEDELRRVSALADAALALAKAGPWYANPEEPDRFMASERMVALHGGGAAGENQTLFEDWYVQISSVEPERVAFAREQIVNVMMGLENFAEFDYPYHHETTGKLIWVRNVVQGITDSSGVVVRIMGLSQDVTEFRNQQIELEKERATLQHILDFSPVGVGFAVDHVVRYMNRCLQDIVCVTEGECSFPAAANGEHLEKILKALELGPVRQVEIATLDAAGTIHDTLATFDRAEYRGERGVLAWLIDITELKRIEKELVHARNLAEAATRAKSDFLANMSHEIRTPMNAIIGMGHLIRKSGMTPEQRNYIDKLDISANMLLGIINDILDFSKIEAGKMDMEHLPFNLGATLENIAELHMPAAENKGLKLTIAASEDAPDRLVGDAMRLQQVLSNLVSNAVKFTKQGAVTITVQRVESSVLDGVVPYTYSGIMGIPETVVTDVPSALPCCVLQFSVTDTGIGMSSEQCRNLFQPFVQADSSTTRRYGGTGLGLTICSRLIRLMGGEIGLDSAPGLGSSFIFTAVFDLDETEETLASSKPSLPGSVFSGFDPTGSLLESKTPELVVSNSAEEIGNPASGGIPVPAGQAAAPIRILVVDDNEINRMVAEGILEMFGIIVDTAQDGLEAVEKGCSGVYDLILMDIQMPGMDGLEATRNLRASNCPDLPIIAMTAHAMSGDRERSLEAGMNDHVTKPIDPDILYSTVMRWIDTGRIKSDGK